MNHKSRFTFQLGCFLVLAPMMMAGVRTSVSERNKPQLELPALDMGFQLDHATELAAARQIASVDFQALLSPQQMGRKVLEAVKRSLPPKHRARAFEIASAVIRESNHHGMDPFFLLAIIKTESNFRIKARGRHGEIGLMQIMPSTGRWLAAQAGVTLEGLQLENPAINIRLGAMYFAKLRRAFKGSSSHYIAAYNMGSGNVRKLMELELVPKVYPGKVLKNYRTFYTEIDKVARDVRHIAQHKTKAKQFTNVTTMPIKLETRVVADKCFAAKCRGPRVKIPMPGWAST